MSDLIDRQSAIDIVEFECGEWIGLARTIVEGIKQLPSAEPEILRCKDCKHYRKEKDWHVCDLKISWSTENQSCGFAKRRRQ